MAKTEKKMEISHPAVAMVVVDVEEEFLQIAGQSFSVPVVCHRFVWPCLMTNFLHYPVVPVGSCMRNCQSEHNNR